MIAYVILGALIGMVIAELVWVELAARYRIVPTLCRFNWLPQHHEEFTCWLWWSWRPLTDKERAA